MLSSTTSPLTPLISTQSPRRMPLRPMSTNQPMKATMKVLECHGKAGADDADHGGGLPWQADQRQDDDHDPDQLQRDPTTLRSVAS